MLAPDAGTLVEQAQQLLEKKDLDSLLLAALKLRMAIEAITYRKLSGYSKYVPAEVRQKWQPTHAMKMLLQFEPDADSNCTVYLGVQREFGVPAEPTICLGEHKTFDVKWLQRNYHRLGSYLHYPVGKRSELDIEQWAPVLAGMAEEVASVAKSPVHSFSLAMRVTFDCVVCGTKCPANLDGVRKTGMATCVDPDCGAVHHLEEVENGWKATLDASELKCVKCEHVFPVQNRFIKLGYEFDCPNCGERYKLTACQWRYEVSGGAR